MGYQSWIGAVCCIWGIAVCASAANVSTALDVLEKNSERGDIWLPTTAIEADFNCDGRLDILVRGWRGTDAIVALVPAAEGKRLGKPDIFSVPVLEKKTVRIAKEAHNCDLDGEPILGCKLSSSCWDFRVERDSIDSLHCYWDRLHRRTACWTR